MPFGTLSESLRDLADAFAGLKEAIPKEGDGMGKKAIEPMSMYSYSEDGELLWIAGSTVTPYQDDASTTLVIKNAMGHYELNIQPRQRKELIEALLEHHEKYD